MKQLVLNTTSKIVLLSCTLFIGQYAVAQSNLTTAQYIEVYKNMAIDEMDRSGIPASIKLAQGILESNSGNSELARFSNNHFGIKCHNGWAGGEYYKKDDDRNSKGELIKSCFRVYGSPYESYIDHTAFLSGKQRYAFLFNYPKEDYISWAKGLKTAGYATAPTYPEKLIRVIEENNLSQYDYLTNRPQPMAQHTTPPPVKKDPVPVVVETPKPVVIPEAKEEETVAETPPVATPSPNDWGTASLDNMAEIRESATSEETVFPKQYQSGIFTINQVKVVSSKKEDTPYEVAVRYDLTVKKLLKYNDLKQGDKLITNQYVFLQSKRGKYRDPRTYHRVAASDNMYIISQLYGIKLNSLKSRNLLEGNEEPAIGQKVYLNGKAKSKPILRKRTIQRPKSNKRVPKKDIRNFVDEPLTKLSENIKPKQEKQTPSKKSSKRKTDKKDNKRVYDAVTTRTAKTIAKEQTEIEATEEHTPNPIVKTDKPGKKQPMTSPKKKDQPTVVTTPEQSTIVTPEPTVSIPPVSIPEIEEEKQQTVVHTPTVVSPSTAPEIQHPVNTKPGSPVHQPVETTVHQPIETTVHQSSSSSNEMQTPSNETVEVISEYYIVVDEDGNMKKVPIGASASTTIVEPSVQETVIQEPVVQEPIVQETYQQPVVEEEFVIRSEPVIPVVEPQGEPYYMEESVVQQTTPSPQNWNSTDTSVETATQRARTHTVQKGDTLYSLSKKYDVNIQMIRDINGISMNTIKVGQTLRLDY